MRFFKFSYFALIIDEIIREIKGIKGCKKGWIMFNITCYTDNVIFIMKNENNQQRLLFQFNKSCNKYDIEIRSYDLYDIDH